MGYKFICTESSEDEDTVAYVVYSQIACLLDHDKAMSARIRFFSLVWTTDLMHVEHRGITLSHARLRCLQNEQAWSAVCRGSEVERCMSLGVVFGTVGLRQVTLTLFCLEQPQPCKSSVVGEVGASYVAALV